MSTVTKKESPFNYIRLTAKNFADRETWGGLILILCTVIALIFSNSSLADEYSHFWEERLIIANENFQLNKSLHHWVNDGLMAIFFFVIGLELKREIFVGELSSWKNASLPIFGAIGGMVVPAFIFMILNYGTATEHGWGIPMATDIAYSLGILGLLGKRVPVTLKVFLTALAIVDDLGAILVIAFFYTAEINGYFLLVAFLLIGGLFLLNYIGVRKAGVYLLAGVLLWVCFLYSGVHATMAGVLLAFTIPLKVKLKGNEFLDKTKDKLKELEETDLEEGDALKEEEQYKIIKDIRRYTIDSRSPLLRLENNLTFANAFFIVPLFALANAGVTFTSEWTAVFSENLGIGILTGLLIGKFCGVFLFSFLSSKLKLSSLPKDLTWIDMAGMSILTGIGFTMSLFISNLAFDIGSEELKMSKIAILIASVIAAVVGLIFLKIFYNKKHGDEATNT